MPVPQEGPQDLNWEGVGPCFRQAFEMLLEAHMEDLQAAYESNARDKTGSGSPWESSCCQPKKRDNTGKVVKAAAVIESFPIIHALKRENTVASQVKEDVTKDEQKDIDVIGVASRSEGVDSRAPQLTRGPSWRPETPRQQAKGQKQKSEQKSAPESKGSKASHSHGQSGSKGSKATIGHSTALPGLEDSDSDTEREATKKKQQAGDATTRERLSTNSNSAAGRVRRDSDSGTMVQTLSQFRAPVPVDEHEYDVSDYYYSEGLAQAIASSDVFGNMTLCVIAVNAVYMGFDADYNHADSLNEAHWIYIMFENLFCIFFTLEWCVRFAAFDGKCNCLNDHWFKFDSFLLVIIIIETWVVTLVLKVLDDSRLSFNSGSLRLLRLLRLARLVRLMRAFPELLTLMDGMMVAMRAVVSAMILLVMALYAWGITMHSFLKDDDALYPYWGTVARSMMTLFANGALGDSIGEVLRSISGNYPALLAMLAFIGFASMTVLNMLIGILCEVVTQVSSAEKEELTLWKLKSTVLVMLKRIDENHGGTISREELHHLLRDEEALVVMNDLNIDIHHFMHMAEMYFQEGDMAIPYIMQLLVDNQGGRPTTVQDMCNFTTFQTWARKNELGSVESVLRMDLVAIENEVTSLKHLIQRQAGIIGQPMREGTMREGSGETC